MAMDYKEERMAKWVKIPTSPSREYKKMWEARILSKFWQERQ